MIALRDWVGAGARERSHGFKKNGFIHKHNASLMPFGDSYSYHL